MHTLQEISDLANERPEVIHRFWLPQDGSISWQELCNLGKDYKCWFSVINRNPKVWRAHARQLQHKNELSSDLREQLLQKWISSYIEVTLSHYSQAQRDLEAHNFEVENQQQDRKHFIYFENELPLAHFSLRRVQHQWLNIPALSTHHWVSQDLAKELRKELHREFSSLCANFDLPVINGVNASNSKSLKNHMTHGYTPFLFHLRHFDNSVPVM